MTSIHKAPCRPATDNCGEHLESFIKGLALNSQNIVNPYRSNIYNTRTIDICLKCCVDNYVLTTFNKQTVLGCILF